MNRKDADRNSNDDEEEKVFVPFAIHVSAAAVVELAPKEMPNNV